MTEPTPQQRLTKLYEICGYGRQSAQLATDLLAEHDAGKDIAPSSQLGDDASTLSSDVLALLAALRDALDVPRAILTAADEEARAALLHERAHSARIALNSILDREAHLPGVTERLADRTTDSPIDYTVWVPKGTTGGGQA